MRGQLESQVSQLDQKLLWAELDEEQVGAATWLCRKYGSTSLLQGRNQLKAVQSFAQVTFYTFVVTAAQLI